MCPALRFDFLKCWLLDPTMATMQVETHFVQSKPQQSTHTPQVDFSSNVRTSNFESLRSCCFFERQAESKSKSKFIELPLNELEAPCSQLNSFFASAEPKELYKTEEDRKWLMEKVVASPALSFAVISKQLGGMTLARFTPIRFAKPLRTVRHAAPASAVLSFTAHAQAMVEPRCLNTSRAGPRKRAPKNLQSLQVHREI